MSDPRQPSAAALEKAEQVIAAWKTRSLIALRWEVALALDDFAAPLEHRVKRWKLAAEAETERADKAEERVKYLEVEVKRARRVR